MIYGKKMICDEHPYDRWYFYFGYSSDELLLECFPHLSISDLMKFPTEKDLCDFMKSQQVSFVQIYAFKTHDWPSHEVCLHLMGGVQDTQEKQ